MEESRKPARKSRAAAAPKPAAKKAAATVKPRVRKAPATPGSRPAVPTAAEREQRVRMAAYFRAQRRGFEPGHEWEDWLAAEAEVGIAVVPVPAPVTRKPSRRKKAD